MLELYHSGLTTCSKQVWLCLREKGIDYVSRYIELWNYENLNPDYLKLNPNGVVPTLVHDGRAIFNSFVIMEFIEDLFPEISLRPEDPNERARMRLWTWTADDVHPSITMITYSNRLQDKIDDLSAEDQQIMLAHTPAPERQERWRRIVTGGYSEDEIRSSLDRIGFALDRAEAHLADGPWFAGSTYSLADIAMLAIIHRYRELYPELIAPTDYPRISDWRDRMMARPAVAWVYSPDTEEVPGRPAGKSVAGIGVG